MVRPVYSKGGNGGVRRNSVKGGVGMTNLGQKNLLRHARGAGGRFENTPGAVPVHLEAHRWASVDRYRNMAFSGQLQLLLQQITEWSRHVTTDCHKVLLYAMEPTFIKSQVYCPVSVDGSKPYYVSGTLKASGKLEIKHKAGSAGGPNSPAEVSITYGGNGVPFYAVFVHEIPKQHTPPTRYKFLEAALKEDMSAIQSRLADGMRIVASGRT